MLRACFLDGSLKNWGIGVWSKLFASRKELGVGDSLPVAWHCARPGV